MSYKTILTVLPNPETARTLLPAAIAVAEQFGAHLTAIHIRQLYEMYPGAHGAISLRVYDQLTQDTKRLAEETRAVFDEASAKTAATLEWREEKAFLAGIPRKLTQSALRSDLIVMSARDGWSGDDLSTSTLHDVILGTGRPVLMLPEDAQPAAIGRNILLCWQPTREASAAAHNALPWLKTADLTTILTIADSSSYSMEAETEGHDLANMLARHDCKTEIRHITRQEPTIGAQILKEARISGTDLIVMGAFGHNRLHDIFFTDATREVIRNTKLPVLFSG
ncbi:universal stress protein [Algicella marina]|uniref:UspA domain-containing protein n=1 Tax=Algicella marina TaxID=2683284 RepID=A0A6P1T384_9RHOB|nr:universal stress protein [Algicella marina]QHQ37188.1 hypothetical protein GO499_19365 [Algicella marina]